MKKKIFTICIIMLLSLVLCSCSGNDAKKKEKFMQSFEPELTTYFTEFSKEACDVMPYKITPGAEYISPDDLKNSNPSFENYLNNKNFFFKIGFTKENDCYTDEEINDMIKNAIANNLSIDFYFDNDDYTIYKIRNDGVTIDMVTGKDGGLYHEVIDYNVH